MTRSRTMSHSLGMSRGQRTRVLKAAHQIPRPPASSRENPPCAPTSRGRTTTQSVAPTATSTGCNRPRNLGLRIPRPGRPRQTAGRGQGMNRRRKTTQNLTTIRSQTMSRSQTTPRTQTMTGDARRARRKHPAVSHHLPRPPAKIRPARRPASSAGTGCASSVPRGRRKSAPSPPVPRRSGSPAAALPI